MEQEPELGRGHRMRKVTQRMADSLQQQEDNIISYKNEYEQIEE